MAIYCFRRTVNPAERSEAEPENDYTKEGNKRENGVYKEMEAKKATQKHRRLYKFTRRWQYQGKWLLGLRLAEADKSVAAQELDSSVERLAPWAHQPNQR